MDDSPIGCKPIHWGPETVSSAFFGTVLWKLKPEGPDQFFVSKGKRVSSCFFSQPEIALNTVSQIQ